MSGVTPPGNQKVGEGPGPDWAAKMKKARGAKAKDNRRAFEKAESSKTEATVPDDFDLMRPMEGFVPNIFAGLKDPDDMKAFLKALGDGVVALEPDPTSVEDFASVVTQSSAPFEVVVGFTILSQVIGDSGPLRRRYGIALERGAKTFFNLARRMGNEVKIPRGLIVETVDPIFYDLPTSAYRVPFAYATYAFVMQMGLLRTGDDEAQDERILKLGQDLYDRFIGRRSLGDQSLSGMFPFELPDWAPDNLE